MQHIFLVFTFLACLVGPFIYNVHLEYVILGVCLYSATGISIFYHRLLSHNSFKTNKLIEYIGVTLCSFGNNGSPATWAGVHINHHKYTDTDKDPHTPTLYGLYKQLLIVTSVQVKDPYYMKRIIGEGYELSCNRKTVIKILKSSNYYKFLHNQYYYFLFGWSALLLLIGGVELALSMHWIPAFIGNIVTSSTNYFSHNNVFFSYRNFETKDNSYNNIFLALFNGGESLHNNHHKSPSNWSFSSKWWEIDFSDYIIRLIRCKN